MKAIFTKSSPLFLSVLSALLLSTPWFGMGGFTIFVGWIPMLYLSQRLRCEGRKGFLWWVFLTLALWHIFTCFWVSWATILAAPAVPLVCGSTLWLAWAVFNYVVKRGSKIVAYSVLVSGWIVAEWWLGYGEFGFAWLRLGAAWANNPMLVQWYSLFGTYGGTLWVILANILLYEAIKSWRRYIIPSAVVVILPMVASIIMYYNHSDDSSKVLEVAVIQPNIDAYEKYSSISADAQTQNIIRLASDAPRSTMLYVAPETALTRTVDLRQLKNNRDIIAIQDFLKHRGQSSVFIVGASSYDGEKFYNSALYIDTSGVTVYHKRKLVYGVEYVPKWLRDVIGMIDLGGYVGSLGRSDAPVVCQMGDSTRVGAVVCYESIYGEFFAEWVLNGAQMMAIITNDGWWGDTPGYKQHFSYARLRAIETNRWVVRSANTGISGIIDSRGDVLQTLGWDRRGTLSTVVPLNSSQTIYTLWGDIVLRLSFYTLALCLLYTIAMLYRKRENV